MVIQECKSKRLRSFGLSETNDMNTVTTVSAHSERMSRRIERKLSDSLKESDS